MAYKSFTSTQFKSLEPVVPWKFLDELIAFYCDDSAPKILDATVNKGRIWGSGKSRYKYVGMDIDPSVKPDVVGDNTNMPFENESWDIVVYDPPHCGDQGKSDTEFAKKYGTGMTSKNPNGKWGSLAHTYPPFLAEANRVLKPKGLLLVKLIDYTHSAKFQFATAEFWYAAKEFGFELQGLNILPRNGVITDTKWKKAYHPRQNHCTWMAFKKLK